MLSLSLLFDRLLLYSELELEKSVDRTTYIELDSVGVVNRYIYSPKRYTRYRVGGCISFDKVPHFVCFYVLTELSSSLLVNMQRTRTRRITNGLGFFVV